MAKQILMKLRLLIYALALGLLFPLIMPGSNGALACSDAGTAAASADSVCYNTPVTLTLTGYLGTIFQWQSFNGTSWVDETGPGSNSDTYVVDLSLSGLFRAIVTEVSCPSDTSNEVQIVVGTIPVPTAGNVFRCGPGTVTLSGTGNGTLQWFDSPNATTPIATGSPVNVFIPATTTLYVADQTIGGGGANSPVVITEFELTSTDNLELQNVSPFPVDVTGWKVAISDDYADINQVNTIVQTLSGTLNPGDLINFTDDAAGPNYWGINMFWAAGAFPGFSGWALIIDDQNNIKDFAAWNWPAASIQSMSAVVNGATITPGTFWTGDGVNTTNGAGGISFQRVVNQDNNISSDFAELTVSTNATNPGLTLPFTGFGCNSPLVPVEVNITPSDAVTIDATATSFCLSGSATLTALSNNANYNYTWSPATGLNTTTGATVICTPPGPGNFTYVVIGDDGACSNVDTITISVGTPTVAGAASSFQDTVCLGKTTDLVLTGSTGFIQWQSLSGSTWIDETGPGYDSPSYTITPTTNATFRAYVYSGSCPPDSSNSIDIVVLSITDPITTNDSVCGGGSMTLLATGPGNLNWYTVPAGGIPVNTGGTYTFSATQTTTFYVEAFAGTEYHIGPATPAIGNQLSTTSNDYGLAFDVIRPVTIDVVHVSPAQTGTVTINLRQSAGGPILATYSQAVTANTGLTIVPVGFSVPVGTGYRMEIASGGPTLQQNSTGALYPYTAPNGPLSITGYYNPNYNTGGAYLWMYDWIVSEGCRSARIPAIGVVNSFPSIPTITQNWNTLTSSSATGNQWFLNGSPIAGATNQNLAITQVGNYSVTVTINGCATTSAVFQVLTIGLNELSGGIMNLYPNPAGTKLHVSVLDPNQKIESLIIIDISGRVVYETETANMMSNNIISIPVTSLPNGIYTLELKSGAAFSRKQFVVEH